MQSIRYPVNRYGKFETKKNPLPLAPYRCPNCKGSHRYQTKEELLAIIKYARIAIKKLEEAECSSG